MILLNAHWLYFSHVKKLYWKKRELYLEGLFHKIGLILYIIKRNKKYTGINESKSLVLSNELINVELPLNHSFALTKG